MTCHELARYLSLTRGEALPPEAAAHLAGCERCRALFEALGAAATGTSNYRNVPLPAIVVGGFETCPSAPAGMGADADLSHPRAYWNDGRPLDVGHRRMACPNNASPGDDFQRNLRKHSGGGIWSVEADDSRIAATLSRRTRRGGGGITLCRSGGGRFSPAVQFRPALRLAGVFRPRTRDLGGDLRPCLDCGLARCMAEQGHNLACDVCAGRVYVAPGTHCLLSGAQCKPCALVACGRCASFPVRRVADRTNYYLALI